MNTVMHVPPLSRTMFDDHEVINVLDDLIEVARDEEEGFRQAAEKAMNPSVQNQLAQFCRQRGEFVRELQGLERAFGKTREGSVCLGGTFHRVWSGIRTAIESHDDDVLLEEAERGEASAHEAYEKALEGTILPPTVRESLVSHSTEILRTRDSLHEMKRGCASA